MVAVADNQSELVTFQYNVWAVALAFALAAAAFIFVSYGIAIGFAVGAIFLFACAHNFDHLARLKVAWPLAVAEQPLRGHWEVFRFTTIAALLLAGLVSSISATAIYIFELKRDLTASEARQQVRHLKNDQKDRIRRGMALGPDENYYVQVNSLGGCDECALFSDEIRAFINTLPGWKAGGGPLQWPMAESQHYGLWLLGMDKDRHAPPMEKIAKAFADGGLPLQYSEGLAIPGLFVILIARAQ
jgi:hypothetical protein